LELVVLALDLIQIGLFYRSGLWTVKMKAEVRPENEF
jgi:hypothetical protein